MFIIKFYSDKSVYLKGYLKIETVGIWVISRKLKVELEKCKLLKIPKNSN